LNHEGYKRYLQDKKLIESNGYVPQPHQLLWHNNETRFLIAVCGRQIGKTVGAINELIRRSILNPNTRNWYITNDYTQAKRNVWDTLKRYITPKMGVKFNESELKAQFPNGSKTELIGVENAESLRGAAVNFMILDEYADFPRTVWPKVLRPMLSTTAGDVWFIGTPKGMGNDLYDKFFTEDTLTTKYKLPTCDINEGQLSNFLSEYSNAQEIEHAYSTLPKDAFDQEYLAEFTRPSGTVYSDWPLENFKEVNYDVNLPLHISFDFGINDPTSIIWIQPNGSEFRVVDYYEASNANLAHFVSVIRSKPYKEPELYTGDPAGKARTLTTGTSPIELLSQSGIQVRTKDGVKIPDQIRMTHGLIKSLFVDSKLTRFRDCLLNYRYPEIKENVKNQENEIPIHDEFSHAMRALEYYAVNIKDIAPQNTYIPPITLLGGAGQTTGQFI
jgi:phage terminase large subunit